MQEVHIFLITSSHAPKMRKAWYRYILVCQGKTLEKKTDVQDVTGHQLVMECAVAALQRMIRAGDDHNPYRQPLSGEWTWKDDSLEIGGMEKRKWSGT